MLKHLGDIEKKTILDLGCSIGKLSVEIAKKVGSHGKVHATEVSQKSLDVAKKIAKKEGVNHNISFVLENEETRHKLHESIHDLDGAVSIGVLGYLKNPDKLLKELHKRLKPGSKIYFVDYDHIFKVVQTKEWLEKDEHIKNKFHKAGFKIDIDRENSILWEIIHIFGHKPKKKKRNTKKHSQHKKKK